MTVAKPSEPGRNSATSPRPSIGIWPTLPPQAHLARRSPPPRPHPLESSGTVVYARARQAMFWGLRALGIGAGDEVLMPAYHHGSEVEAAIRVGAAPRFYAGDSRLRPDPAELDSLLGPRVRAFHLIHYLGFGQDARRWRDWCDERGLALIEDAAQAWLASTPAGRRSADHPTDGLPVGSLGDLAFFCLYKSVGVPDGGATVCKAALHRPAKRRPVGFTGVLRRHSAWAAQRSQLGARLVSRLAEARRARPFDVAAEVALGEPDSSASRATLRLAPRLADDTVPARRRENYRTLLAALGPHVPAPFERCDQGASPWVFPVVTDHKPGLLAALAGQGIRALDLWSAPHPSLPAADFPEASRRRATTVGLPVHQELRPRDVERIADAARGWLDGAR